MADRYIDADRWPGLCAPVRSRFQTRRAREVTQRLEDLLGSHGIGVDPGQVPFFDVRDGQALDRVTAAGWLGLAEGYMAGEWAAEPLPDVLAAIVDQPLQTRRSEVLGGVASRRKRQEFGTPTPGELPEGLVELYAGDTRATGGAVFASGAHTTETQVVRVGEDSYPVDVTWHGTPDPVERRDLDDAQRRRIELMLDDAGVRPGDRVLELPSSGGMLAIQAARRGASVDVITGDEEHAQAVVSRINAAGVAGGVRVEVIDAVVPSPRQWSGRYEAIFAVERVETMGDQGVRRYLRAVDRMLTGQGRAVVQMLVLTEDAPEYVSETLDVMRAYVWPGLHYPTVAEVRETAVKYTGLRVGAQRHLGAHYRATVPLWRANFAAAGRQAAAAGFDAVFRRLWDYQLAFHEALVQRGFVDCVEFTFLPRE
ncbi:class I SAM-dependent methyltransferase [Corynebacterium heidelbergense]|uniref:Cyclopropane-fatty-acyl-phospholipid synthase n=1 Tax=Corynebacterium heidelbergense TaxID=2055947 RepID=A0A364VAA5_9CORY|nr:class I SAM-dependent methyltransferase [Corynebacterium heidelbergense]RAV33603.1 cyclopropane-fatty-acyl-phospholipid synthase [Corynebacterium heidelbergense]WCZ36495.1 Cyclopropane-fatty-acyl-phospholipid synthase [Corynebacterium heidelbergense]